MKTNPLLLAALLGAGTTLAQTAYHGGANAVRFTSENTSLNGNLYLPTNYEPGKMYPALLVEGPWTQVKEQIGAMYGPKLAEQGFVVLAFDHRFFGESGGEPRQFESPAAKITDLKNAVSYLQTLPMVNREAIGAVGVCFGASYMAYAAAEDRRIRAFATVAAWLHDDASLRTVYGEDGYAQRKAAGEKALAAYQANKRVIYVPAYSQTDKRAAMQGALDYYANAERGAIPQWTNEFAEMSWVDWMRVDGVSVASRIQCPVLNVHSDQSALPDNVRAFNAKLPSRDKALYWVSNASHPDFYDQPFAVNEAVSVAGPWLMRHLVAQPALQANK